MKTFDLPLLHRTPWKALLGLIFALGLMTSGRAQETASATMTSSALGGGNFQYTITLNNTSASSSIGTFWYSWIPGYDFLPATPNSIVSPSGWSSTVTGGFPGDGNAIEWTANSTGLAAGSSLNFSFDIAADPATLAANSSITPNLPTGTSYVYSGGAFSDGGYQFVVAAATATPEPSASALFILGGLGLLGLLSVRRLNSTRTR